MKFIAIADIHLSLYSQDPIKSGLPMRLYHLNIMLRNIAEYAMAHNIRVIVFAGDVFHTKSIIHSLAQSILLDFIRHYSDMLIFYVIDGNHDVSSKTGEGVSALKCLDNEFNVRMMHEPKQIDDILFVPWDPRTMKDTIKKAEASYLISHFGLNEASLSSGISIVSDIGLKDLSHFKNCIIGHYHLPQEVGNVWIPGSIIQLDWGEKNEEKRFLIVDTNNDLIESIPTEGYKKHIEYELRDDNKDIIFKEAREMKKQGHFVKILKFDDVDTSRLDDEFRVIDKREKDITNRGIDSSMSTKDKLNKYMEIMKVPQEKKEAYMAKALEVIQTCNSIQ